MLRYFLICIFEKTGNVWVTLLNFVQIFNGVGYDVSFRTFILCIFKFWGAQDRRL